MPRSLVVVEDPDRDRRLLERARAFAVGAETDLVVAALATTAEYEEVAETLETIGRAERTTYDEDAVLEGVSGDVDDLATEVLGDAVGYEFHAQVVDAADQADAVLDLAASADCDHVFLPGIRRSPVGKAVFGDRTQRLILEFDGCVTVSME
jgi:nucleotide-binding universal stress UspA family protein